MADLTPWFPANVKPVWTGTYEVRAFGISLMRTWHGAWFVLGSDAPADAQDLEWRGLAADPRDPRGVLEVKP